MTSSPIAPFKITVPDSSLQTLKDKLTASSFPDEVEFSDNWDYGTPLSDIRRLARYWRDEFDWRAQEKKLNEIPQFTTKVEIEGFGELDIHFIHQKSKKKESMPLLFCHGWPGSFLEVTKILPLLTDGDGDGPSFHVVAPSLPNFGFSEGAKKAGFGIPQYSEAIHKVMLKLGYNQYITQGGDWGYSITRVIGLKYPSHCVASHLNYIQINRDNFAKVVEKARTTPLTAQEDQGIERTKWFHEQGYGYNNLQSTKPNTIAFALKDSPIALLSWIYEKLHDWADSYPWTDDEILTWISIYQFSRAGPEASVRIYYEASVPSQMQRKLYDFNEKVPLGLSYFPKDLAVPPTSYGHTLGPVVFEKRHDNGGHFSAFEKPALLAADLKMMFGEKGGAYDIARRFAV